MPAQIRTLVLMHTATNTGFAIAPLESTFYRVATELACGADGCVHFAYRRLEGGYPQTLPPGVPLVEFDPAGSSDQLRRLTDFIRAQGINFVLAFDLQPTAPVFLEMRRAGVQCIVSYWGAEISSRNRLWKRTLKRLEIMFSSSRLDGLIFESKAMANLARYGRGVPDSMIDVVPLGIDVGKFSPIKSTYIYENFPFERSRRVVVYAGHMEPRKGVRNLIEAACQLLSVDKRDDVAFLLFGDRPGERDAFLPLYAHLDIAQHIHFAGYRDDLPLCFPSCFAGTIPSSGWDSFPRTSIELAAAGLPLVVSRLGGLPEAIEDGKTGLLFSPGDSSGLAKQLSFLLDNPEVAARMGAAGRERCEQQFTLDIQHRRLIEAIAPRLAKAGLR